AHRLPRRCHSIAQRTNWPGTIARHRKMYVRVFFDKSHDAANVRSDWVVSEENVLRSRLGQHLGFCDRCALVLRDAAGQLHLDDLARLVRLAMRPQSSRRSADANHLVEIFLYQIAKDDQARGENAVRVGDGIATIDHDVASSESGLLLVCSGVEPF